MEFDGVLQPFQRPCIGMVTDLRLLREQLIDTLHSCGGSYEVQDHAGKPVNRLGQVQEEPITSPKGP